MKYIETRINWTKKLGAAAALGTFAFAPFFSAPQGAQADPPSHAPAHGYRRNQNNGDWNRDQAQRVTHTGVVISAFAGNGFTLRTDSGRTLRVQANNTVPRNLSNGDRVSVYGYASNNGMFIGESVRVLSSAGRDGRDGWWNRDRDDRDEYGEDDWYRRDVNTERTVSGVVTRDLGGNAFELRTDDGRLVTVRARNGEPARLTRGDRVVVQGRFNTNRNEFVSDSVRITRNEVGGRVNFPGTVTSVDSANRLRVRGDNGRTYTIATRSGLPSSLRSGDRVRVTGDVRRGIVAADRIQVLNRNDDRRNRDDDDKRISFTGVVTEVAWLGSSLTVRRDDGKEFRLTTPRNAGSFRRGDRVRVVGIRLDNNRVQADTVTRQ